MWKGTIVIHRPENSDQQGLKSTEHVCAAFTAVSNYMSKWWIGTTTNMWVSKSKDFIHHWNMLALRLYHTNRHNSPASEGILMDSRTILRTFRAMTSCSMTGRYQRFGGRHCLHLQGRSKQLLVRGTVMPCWPWFGYTKRDISILTSTETFWARWLKQ
jgi:hypothetical protein